MVEAFHHRPGPLKQANKKFKSKHATKGALKDAAKGRVARQSLKSGTPSHIAAQNRLNRRNHAKQTQNIKRNALVSASRIFSGVDGAPRIVSVIPLTEDVNVQVALSSLIQGLDVSPDDSPKAGLHKIHADRFKTSLQFWTLSYGNLYMALDACKVADYVVFVFSSTVEVDSWGDTLLRTLQSQGLPDSVSVLYPNENLDSKSRSAILKSLLSFIQYFVPSQSRVYDLHIQSDRLNALRALSEGNPGEIRWREGRTWILGESSEWDDGMLKVTGVVRGAPLSANRLVHIPGFGDYQISKIFSAPHSRKKGMISSMDVEPVLMAEPDPSLADSLVSTNDPDELANEQTWPTEEEMNVVQVNLEDDIPEAVEGTTPKRVRRIPKGMSEYQAAWIVDEEENHDAGEAVIVADVDITGDQLEEEEMHDLTLHDAETDLEYRQSNNFQDLDINEEAKQLETWRNRRREEDDDLAFPDEMDTPQDSPARIRFQRYRALKSFRTSPWDPLENLPRDYARIFQFEDFKRTEHSVQRRSAQETGVIEAGSRVTVHLKGVPQQAASVSPITIFSLLQHEHKVAVLNFTAMRNTEYVGSVRSKDPLILCVGPRRLSINPIYSQYTRGGGKGANNVHKFERYLRHGSTYVATTYGPVVYGKQPCVLLRETENPQAPQLVAMGSFMNPDATRIIAKRIILTGHPIKVHKKTATVRYMFFNPEDVRYFKPIQLHTKHGRSGHIRESLGTHGYFKAHFDAPINQMDTICMCLYKRIFPKWAQPWTLNNAAESMPSSTEPLDAVMEE